MKLSVVLLLLALKRQEGHCSENKRLLLDDPESIPAIIHRLETRIDDLNSTHSKDAATHAKDVAELKATHQKDVAELRAAHTKEIADLKAGLNAEKLERCRTGSIHFEHAECATHQCSQAKVAVFSPPFSKAPVVTFAFSKLDVSDSHNLRISAGVSGVTTSSATLKVNTWSDTIVYESNLNWIACPDL